MFRKKGGIFSSLELTMNLNASSIGRSDQNVYATSKDDESKPANSEDANGSFLYRMYRNRDSTIKHGEERSLRCRFFIVFHRQGACMNMVCMTCTEGYLEGERTGETRLLYQNKKKDVYYHQ